MAVEHITAGNFEQMVLRADRTVMVDFWADWCGPCRMLSPVIGQIAEERKDVLVCKVNVDDNPELATEYKVMNIPLVIVFKNGQIYKKSVGAVPKSELLAMLD